jgi:hypothetical protein
MISGNYNETAKSFSGSGQMTDGSWIDFKMNYVNIVDTAKTKTTIPKPTPKIDYGKVFR